MADNKHIDELLADKLKGHAVRPSHEVWARIAAQEPKSGPWLGSRSIAAALLVGMMAVSGLLDPFAGNRFQLNASFSSPATEAQSSDATGQSTEALERTTTFIARSTTSFDQRLVDLATAQAEVESPSKFTEAAEKAAEIVPIAPAGISTKQFVSLAEPSETTPAVEETEFLVNTMAVANARAQQEKLHAQDEWYVGTHGSIQHTSLLNGMTPGSNEGIEDQLNLGASYGVSLGYRLSSNISLETSLVLNSSQGAEYMDVARLKGELIQVEKRLKLQYTQIPLSIKVKRWLGSSDGALNYVAGVQYGYLRASSFTVAGRSFTPEQRQRHDFAVLLGLEYDYMISDRFFMSAGVRGTYSANATSAVELDFDNPDKRNLVVGLRAGINYVLPGS